MERRLGDSEVYFSLNQPASFPCGISPPAAREEWAALQKTGKINAVLQLHLLEAVLNMRVERLLLLRMLTTPLLLSGPQSLLELGFQLQEQLLLTEIGVLSGLLQSQLHLLALLLQLALVQLLAAALEDGGLLSVSGPGGSGSGQLRLQQSSLLSPLLLQLTVEGCHLLLEILQPLWSRALLPGLL
ncbi:hypothetical protein EYF80_002869 [Liparis tanakae]|uniref:Uncharacterized protein n=1 Tax=Liparis tanakae TaxID=230148 RepID=A0A4Z2JB94_9TELE|nr:hypothetical protein EYF80_002869 [Liparis tanakae]